MTKFMASKRLIYKNCVIVSLLTSTFFAYASQEGVLVIDAFQVSSAGLTHSGPVVVTGERKGEIFSALCVKAFEKTSCLATDQLAAISSMTVNGVQISYENGYKETGGRTVYVLLSKGFSESRKAEKLISVFENGEIQVSDSISGK